MIPAEHAHLHITAATHPGMKGKLNEDRYSISAYRLTQYDHTPSVLALLADGIGGHRAGEVAAQLAVESIEQFITRNRLNQPVQVLRQALTYTNQVIIDRAKDDPAQAGMGATCVCAWVIGDRLFVASVGDSRLYLQRGDRLIRLTTDHTWVQEAIDQGSLQQDQIKGHPNAHIIRRYLGTAHKIAPDMRLRLRPTESDAQAEANQGLRLLPGDRLMLCSDGLTDLVHDEEILNILRTEQLDMGPVRLIELANQRGGHDNITVVALEVPQPAQITRPVRVAHPPVSIPARRAQRTGVSWLMVGLLLIAILLMVLLLIHTFNGSFL